MKIPKSEVNKMIKEEFQNMWKKRTLSKRLSEINETLSKMDQEDSLLSEVEASGMQKTSSATGLVPGEQPGVKFQNLNATTLKEEGEEEVDNSGAADMGLDVDIEKPLEVASDEASNAIVAVGGAEVAPMGEFEAKFAELGKSIDAKLAAENGAGAVDAITVAEPESNDFEEVQVDAAEDGADSTEVKDSEGEEDKGEEKEEFDEVKKEGVVTEMEKTSEEGIDGESVAQDAELSTPDGDMKKDTVVSESADTKGAILTEGKKEKKNIFLEGRDAAKQSLILAEQKRMRKFAGLSNEDEE